MVVGKWCVGPCKQSAWGGVHDGGLGVFVGLSVWGGEHIVVGRWVS